jgi:hypothetical protein
MASSRFTLSWELPGACGHKLLIMASNLTIVRTLCKIRLFNSHSQRGFWSGFVRVGRYIKVLDLPSIKQMMMSPKPCRFFTSHATAEAAHW